MAETWLGFEDYRQKLIFCENSKLIYFADELLITEKLFYFYFLMILTLKINVQLDFSSCCVMRTKNPSNKFHHTFFSSPIHQS